MVPAMMTAVGLGFAGDIAVYFDRRLFSVLRACARYREGAAEQCGMRFVCAKQRGNRFNAYRLLMIRRSWKDHGCNRASCRGITPSRQWSCLLQTHLDPSHVVDEAVAAVPNVFWMTE